MANQTSTIPGQGSNGKGSSKVPARSEEQDEMRRSKKKAQRRNHRRGGVGSNASVIDAKRSDERAMTRFTVTVTRLALMAIMATKPNGTVEAKCLQIAANGGDRSKLTANQRRLVWRMNHQERSHWEKVISQNPGDALHLALDGTEDDIFNWMLKYM